MGDLLSKAARLRAFAGRHRGIFAALAVAGMLGFVVSSVAGMLNALDVGRHLELSLLALAAYVTGLGAGDLGEPNVQEPSPSDTTRPPASGVAVSRRPPLQSPGAAAARHSRQIPSSS